MICEAENLSISKLHWDFVFPSRSCQMPNLSREMEEAEFLFLVFIPFKKFFCIFFFLESETYLHLAYRVLSVGRSKKFLSISYDE